MQTTLRWTKALSRTIFNTEKLNRLYVSKFSSFTTSHLPKDGGSDISLDGQEIACSSWDKVGWATDPDTEEIVKRDVRVYENFVSGEEEESLLTEIEPQLKRLRYENSHWDDAIHGFREIERKSWSSKNRSIIERMQKTAFDKNDKLLQHVHVLDLLPTGVIRAHVDSVKFCGDTIAGLCLLTGCVMRFARVDQKHEYADVLLPRFCLYVMKDVARYKFTHEVLESDLSKFKGQPVIRSRRIAVLSRTESKQNIGGSTVVQQKQ